MTLEVSGPGAGVDLSNATLLNASSGEEGFLPLPARAQNFSSEKASSIPSPPVPFVISTSPVVGDGLSSFFTTPNEDSRVGSS